MRRDHRAETPQALAPDGPTAPIFYGQALGSALMLGTAQYPSLAVLGQALAAARPGLVTVSLRRETAGLAQGDADNPLGPGAFARTIAAGGWRLLPNTAGCHSAREAITTAHMARELFATPWIKLEVIGHGDSLHPDPFGTLEAARVLCAEGFAVFPYMTEDLILAERLVDLGCQVLMPWGAPIGSGRGLRHRDGLARLRAAFPGLALVVDAGIGLPSQAAAALEMGYDAVLVNSAVARADDPVAMARAFAQAVAAGRAARQAGPMPVSAMARASTPVLGLADLGDDLGADLGADMAPLLGGQA